MRVDLSHLSPGVRAKVARHLYSRLDETINERAALKARIDSCSKDGKVLLVESGRDCDGVQYSGLIHEIDASLLAYWNFYAYTQRWADGPFYLSPVSYEEAENIHYTSRDRTLEAFENGHPWVI